MQSKLTSSNKNVTQSDKISHIAKNTCLLDLDYLLLHKISVNCKDFFTRGQNFYGHCYHRTDNSGSTRSQADDIFIVMQKAHTQDPAHNFACDLKIAPKTASNCIG